MIIAFDAKRAFQNQSGLGNYSRFVISAMLNQFGKNQYLLYTPKRKIEFLPENGNYTIVQPKDFLSKKVNAYWRTYQITPDLEKRGAELYHGLSHELPHGIEKLKIKKVVTIHDLIFMRYPELYSVVDRYIYKQKFFYACSVADKIIAISEQTKEDIVKFFKINPEKIEVVYQDCNPSFQKKYTQEQKQQVKQKYNLSDQYIVSVGTLEKRKNQLTLLKAFNKIKNNHSVDLVLIGKRTEYQKQLEEYIVKNALQDRVKILNSISFQDLPLIYQFSEISVYISIFEGFGLPVLESLNSGIPVITSDVSCLPEAGGDAAMYISPQDELGLSEAIHKILMDKNLKNSMIEKGYAHALKFRPEYTVAKLMSVYQSVGA